MLSPPDHFVIDFYTASDPGGRLSCSQYFTTAKSAQVSNPGREGGVPGFLPPDWFQGSVLSEKIQNFCYDIPHGIFLATIIAGTSRQGGDAVVRVALANAARAMRAKAATQ